MEIRVTVRNKMGLHARPAALIAQCAAKFASAATLTGEHGSTDARSILGLLTLGAPCGSEVVIAAEGSDAAEVLAALQKLFDENFGEE